MGCVRFPPLAPKSFIINRLYHLSSTLGTCGALELLFPVVDADLRHHSLPYVAKKERKKSPALLVHCSPVYTVSPFHRLAAVMVFMTDRLRHR
jgi:hypothetical protein